MKNISVFSLLLATAFIPTLVTAQIDTLAVDSTSTSKNKNEVTYFKGYKKGRVATYWFGLDFGFNALMDNGDLNLTGGASVLDMNFGKSTNWKIHLFRQEIDIFQRKLKLIYGPTFEFARYNFQNPIRLSPNQPTLTVDTEAQGVRHANNRLYTSWLQVPVMIGYESNPKRRSQSFRAAVGMYGSLMLAANHEYRVDGQSDEVFIKDDFNLNTFRYGVTGRIGFGPITLFADYALNPMFKENQAPAALSNLRSFTIGMTILRWD